MDSEHLRFNQSDGSVSLMVQPEVLAKNQLPSICPDPIVIPNLARISNREQPDRLLCPIRALKFYLKMTKPCRRNRTRLFLPIKGKQDISKFSVSRWISFLLSLPTGNSPVKSLKWRLVFTKDQYSAHCSSSLCLKPYHESSALGSPVRTSMPMTLLSSLNRLRNVSGGSWLGKKQWRRKDWE